MRIPLIVALICLLAGVGPSMICAAADNTILQQGHSWARFGVGSWRKVRIVTESFDDEGQVTTSSTTHNKTTLEEVTPDRVRLKVEVTVEIGGKQIPSQPQIIKQGYAGEQVGQSVSMKQLPGELLVIDGRQIPCEIRQIEVLGGTSKEVTLISYSTEQTPPILRRKSKVSDLASGQTTQESSVELSKFARPINVLGEHRMAYLLRHVTKSDGGTTITESEQVHDIPGEVVSHASKDVDGEGRLLRKSTLDLVAYSVAGNGPPREVGRARARRAKRAR